TWREVKTMKPGSGTTGEYPTVWETPGGGGEPDQWQIGDFAHRIETAAKAPPAGCTEVIPGEPVAPSLREVERPAGDLDWNRRGADVHDLARQLATALDRRVLLRVAAAARPGCRGITAVRQPAGVTVVADPQHLRQVRGRDHGADLQTGAGRALGELLRHAHVDLFERDPVGRLPGFRKGMNLGHRAHVNGLVYTPVRGYNAQDVGARTVVRA